MEEKNTEKEIVSRNRFAYHSDTECRWGHTKGVSQKRLMKCWETGEITEEMLCLMEAFMEMSVLSAKQIERFFWLTSNPTCFQRLRVSDKNPYRMLIRHMIEYGILVIGQMCHEEKSVGSKLYSLSSGALLFLKDFQGSKQASLSEGIDRRFNQDARLGQKLGYETILQILSLNQFHMHFLDANGKDLKAYGRIWVTKDLPANIYVGTEEARVVWSLRNTTDVWEKMRRNANLIRELINKNPEFANTPLLQMVITEDIDMARTMHPSLKEEDAAGVVYTTDLEVFCGKAATRYIAVTEENNYQFMSD